MPKLGGSSTVRATVACETNDWHPVVEANVTLVATLAERVNAALEEVRPAMARDGGDVWLVRIDGSTALVQMVGACGGCAMSTTTLRGLIETTVLARCPEISAVEQA